MGLKFVHFRNDAIPSAWRIDQTMKIHLIELNELRITDLKKCRADSVNMESTRSMSEPERA